MRLSTTFTKTLREVGRDEMSQNAQLLIRAGYIHKELAGVYDYLPLGLKTLENIKTVIRNELDVIGCEEIQLSALQNPEPWKATDRWNSEKVDIWFKTDLSSGGQLGLAPTHEEPITELMKTYISSYKDLPTYVYQFQTKFRNELRAKSGILRGREFLMNDLYSFSADKRSHDKFYHSVERAYTRIFEILGIGDDTHQTFASGGVFSKYSHEFQTVTPVGEDTIYYNDDWSVVLNEEVLCPEVLDELGVTEDELSSTKATEVANIFTLKDKYSKPLGLEFNDRNGKRKPVFMGCYGIGVSRLMGVIAEQHCDERGLIWPENIAPYRYYVIPIGDKAEAIVNNFYRQYASSDIFIIDDRKVRPGQKFADADLMGIPYRMVISDRTIEAGGIEVTSRRNSVRPTIVPLDIFAPDLDMDISDI